MIHKFLEVPAVLPDHIILERDSAKGRCMEMSDEFCVMHLKYQSISIAFLYISWRVRSS